MKRHTTNTLVVLMILFLSQLGGMAPKAIGQSLSCPSNITTVSDPDQCSAVINYPDPVASSFCATNSLSLGDIAFTGYIDDGMNKYSFVLLVDIPSGTSINFTDRGWLPGGGFRDGGENIATWTSTSALSAGTEVLIDDLVASTGTMSGEALQFTDQGDQIFAYKGTPPTAEDQSNFLAAIQMNGEWDLAASERTSTKPDVFTDGVNSISIYPEKDNAVYKCTTTAGTPAELRALIYDQTNWEATNNPSNLNELSTCGFTVYCTASPNLMEGLASGSSFPVGSTTVKYRAAYGDGSTAECSFTVKVEDTQAPAFINCPSSITVNNDPGECGAVVGWNPPKVNDNCPNYNVESTHAPGAFFTAGESTTVTYSATDAAGNSAENCSFTVTVNKDDNLPAPWANSDINYARGTATYEACGNDNFTLTSTGRNYGRTDRHHFAYVELCGDGEITARVRSMSGGGYAGIQMRESLGRRSKKIAIKTKRSNRVYREFRRFTGFSQINSPVPRYNHYWLKIKRTGNTFRVYSSSNGSSWRLAYRISRHFDNCLKVGLFTEGRRWNSWTTAVFDNVSIQGATNQSRQAVDNLPLSQQEIESMDAPETTLPTTEDALDLPSALDVKSTRDAAVPSITVFPNPASSTTTVSFKNFKDEPTQLLIRDSYGRQLKSIQLNPTEGAMETLHLEDLPAGLYIINVLQNGSLKSTEKLIVR